MPAVNDVPHGFLGNAMPSGNRRQATASARVLGSNSNDVRVGKFSAMVTAAGGRAATGAPLLSHVFNIGALGAKKQMIGIGALRIVATMKNLHARWDWPFVNLPRDAMGAKNANSATAVERAVAKIELGARPRPASIALDDERPEAVGKWNAAVYPWHRHVLPQLTPKGNA